MIRKIPRLAWLALPMAYLLYFYRLSAAGMLGPDEPRYASIAREMARSGDWITPRLWGQPWFEKPPLLYWMTGAAFRLGLGADLAPRLPVALLAVAFLAFYWWALDREFGCQAAWLATLILGTSVEWLAYSQIGVTDLPMAAGFSAAMLLALPWIAHGDAARLPAAGALLGLAALAKGLVPLALAAPLVLWAWRRPLGHWLRLALPFLAVALPWYALCYWRNGQAFLMELFWHQHFERLTSTALLHVEPWWFYGKILPAALLPWTPLAALACRPLARRLMAHGPVPRPPVAHSPVPHSPVAHSPVPHSPVPQSPVPHSPVERRPAFCEDRRRAFLLALVVWGMVMFSLAPNKLPGYLLPLMPAAAALLALALEQAASAAAAPLLAACTGLLVAFPVIGPMLPAAIGSGLSRATRPPFRAIWLLPLAIAPVVWLLERQAKPARTLAAAACVALGATGGAVYLKRTAMPEVDRQASSRQLWAAVAPQAARVCVENIHRNWRYPLNYYSVMPLPECSAAPRPVHIRQVPGQPPRMVTVDPLRSGIVTSPFQD